MKDRMVMMVLIMMMIDDRGGDHDDVEYDGMVAIPTLASTSTTTDPDG
jgi:hypothetical protein